MEIWVWLIAIGVGLIILLLALLWLGSRGIVLAKKLKPFADHLAKFQKDAESYPEAVKFYSDLTKPRQPPSKGSRAFKG